MDTQGSSKPRPPIHYLSCILTIILDWIWFLAELMESFSMESVPRILVIIAGVFITCFIAVAIVQRYWAHDRWKGSLLKGAIMGLAACVPYPVVGTFVGVVLLATARIYWKTPSEEEEGE
jgi:glucose-6-phosphate-specific signal transduction histidine kinase